MKPTTIYRPYLDSDLKTHMQTYKTTGETETLIFYNIMRLLYFSEIMLVQLCMKELYAGDA